MITQRRTCITNFVSPYRLCSMNMSKSSVCKTVKRSIINSTYAPYHRFRTAPFSFCTIYCYILVCYNNISLREIYILFFKNTSDSCIIIMYRIVLENRSGKCRKNIRHHPECNRPVFIIKSNMQQFF